MGINYMVVLAWCIMRTDARGGGGGGLHVNCVPMREQTKKR